MNDSRPSSLRALGGAMLVLVGLALLLGQFGVIDAGGLWDYWPLALVALGLNLALQSRSGGRFVGIFFVALGLGILLDNLDVWDFRLGQFWPLVLIGLGLWILRSAVLGSGRPGKESRSADPDFIRRQAFLSGVKITTASQQFTGGDLSAVMAGIDVDLRPASMGPGDAVLKVFAFWGGIEIQVPRNWVVIDRVDAVLGGYEDKTERPAQDVSPQKLIVQGTALMGGIEISN